MKVVNYLDVSLNLNNLNYKPYHKPDNKIFISTKIQILKFLHRLKKSISTLSSNETIFNKFKKM